MTEMKETPDTKAPPIPNTFNLEGMGVIISETIALKQYMLSLENEISQLSSQIKTNEKEVIRLSNLKEETRQLGKKKTELEAELSNRHQELEGRLEKLRQANIQIPVNDPAIVRGSIRL